jgi:hypothetical protein
MLSLLLSGPDTAYNRTNVQEAMATLDQQQPTPIEFLYIDGSALNEKRTRLLNM